MTETTIAVSRTRPCKTCYNVSYMLILSFEFKFFMHLLTFIPVVPIQSSQMIYRPIESLCQYDGTVFAGARAKENWKTFNASGYIP